MFGLEDDRILCRKFGLVLNFLLELTCKCHICWEYIFSCCFSTAGPELLKQVNCQGKLPLDYIQCVATKQSLLHIVKPEESVEDFHAEVKHNFFNQQTEFWTVLFSKMLLNFCSVYNLFTPFSLTIKKLAYSNPLLMTAGSCKFSTCSHTHWFVDLYCKELESFQNLPQYLKETIKELNKCHGEQHQAFAATLEQVTMAMEMSSSYLAGAPPN